MSAPRSVRKLNAQNRIVRPEDGEVNRLRYRSWLHQRLAPVSDGPASPNSGCQDWSSFWSNLADQPSRSSMGVLQVVDWEFPSLSGFWSFIWVLSLEPYMSTINQNIPYITYKSKEKGIAKHDQQFRERIVSWVQRLPSLHLSKTSPCCYAVASSSSESTRPICPNKTTVQT